MSYMSRVKKLQQKIRSHIPLSEAMQFNIVELSENTISVQAPLAPNINIHSTGFAGSIYSLAVLTGWALVTHIMDLQGIEGDLVIARAEIKYRKPVTGEIYCNCSIPDLLYEAFRDDLSTDGKARLTLEIMVGDAQAVLNATYYVSLR